MGRHNKAVKERKAKAKAREENKFPTSPENGTNGEDMETEDGSAQFVKPLESSTVVEFQTVAELQHCESDARQRYMVEGSNPITNKGFSLGDSRTAGGRIRVAGDYRHQTSTSRVDDFKCSDSVGRQFKTTPESNTNGTMNEEGSISMSLPDCCTYTSNGIVCRDRDPFRVSQGERVMNTEQGTAKTCEYDEAMETQGHLYSLFHPDSITVAGVYRDQASTSRVDDPKRIDALGRLLSSVLRHHAVDLGSKMRSDGYVLVKDLLNLRLRTQAGLALSSHTVDDIQEVVRIDQKQGFGLLEENGQLLIRANQGHSIKTLKSEDLLSTVNFVEEVPVCVHGTYLRNLDAIRKEGLKRMGRNYVHFATDLLKEKSVISGMRSDCEVLIHLDVQKYLKDGMKLYRSANGVILAEGKNGVIPPDYFAKIQRLWS